MKKFFTFFDLLVKAGTGVSSTRFNLVYIGVIVILLLLIVGFILLYDVLKDGVINTDLGGLASFVGALTSLLVAVGLTKVSDTIGKKKQNNEEPKE